MTLLNKIHGSLVFNESKSLLERTDGMFDSHKFLEQIQSFLDSANQSIVAKSLTQSGILVLKMTGGCSGCPSGQFEFQETLGSIFQEKFPEVKQIHWETGVSDELIEEALKILRKKPEDRG